MEGNKEFFYLTMHSIHFLFYAYMALDIIMVKDHSDSKRGNPLPPLSLSMALNQMSNTIYNRK